MPLKEEVLKKIEKLQDDRVLKDLDSWLNDELNESMTFTAAEIREVNEGYAEYMAGKTYTNSEAQAQFEKWLKEK